ncbi:hypothetical protein ANAEL_05234 [Anaerolineales bacterium]|nr:hypothetical protein ANAEL_05234 [Anaerolineales bacterium]
MKQTNCFFTVIVFLLVITIATHSPVDNDMWWHLRAGDEMWHQGRILLTDQFSYTKFGELWVNAFWVSDLGLYGLWAIGGFFAVTAAVSLLAAAVLWIIFKRMNSPIILRGLLVILAMAGMVANWTPRPQLLSFLLLAWLDYFLHQHINVKRQPLWVLIPLFALWGNLHGGFIWGALLLLATLAGETINNLLDNQSQLSYKEIGALSIWSAIALLAVSINPNGLRLWKLPFQQVNVSLGIQEWLSPDFHQFYAHPMLWLLFLLIFGLGFAQKRISFTDLFKGLGFAYLFFFAQRNLIAYTIIILPIVEKYLSSAIANIAAVPGLQKSLERFASQTSKGQFPQKATVAINSILISLFSLSLLGYTYLVSTPESIAKEVPAKAVEWIKQNRPRGPIFNSYNWGGYLIWGLRDYPVFIDGRADLYGNELIREWSEIVEGTDKGLGLLESRGINLIFLEPHYSLLNKLDPDEWKKVYSDQQIAIYQRIP